jgi:hypothetical protein
MDTLILLDPVANRFGIKGNLVIDIDPRPWNGMAPNHDDNLYGALKNATEWLKRYSETPVNEMVFICFIEYYSTVPALYLSKMFKELQYIALKGNKVRVDWYHFKDDIEMVEAVEDYRKIYPGLEFVSVIIENVVSDPLSGNEGVQAIAEQLLPSKNIQVS